MHRREDKDLSPLLHISLLTQAQLLDDGAVTLHILLLEISQQATALADHHQQATTAVVVLLVNLQMLGQLVDPGSQNGDLHFGRTGVGLVQAVGFDHFGLFVFENHWYFLLFFIRRKAVWGAWKALC